MARKSTLKVNKITPKVYPLYRFEVMFVIPADSERSPSDLEVVDVFANTVGIDSDELNFWDIDDDDEVLVASFKEWSYFIRREKQGECVGMERLPSIDPPHLD